MLFQYYCNAIKISGIDLLQVRKLTYDVTERLNSFCQIIYFQKKRNVLKLIIVYSPYRAGKSNLTGKII